MLVSPRRGCIILASLVFFILTLGVYIEIWAAFARGHHVIRSHIQVLAATNILFLEPRRRIIILLTVNVIFRSLKRCQKSILLRVFRSRHRVMLVIDVFAKILLPVTEIYSCLEHRIFGFLSHFVKWYIIWISLVLMFVEILVSLTFVVHSIFIILSISISRICKSHTLIYRIPRRLANTICKLPTSLEHLTEVTLVAVFLSRVYFGRRSIICMIGKILEARFLYLVDVFHFEISLALHVFGHRFVSIIEVIISLSQITLSSVILRWCQPTMIRRMQLVKRARHIIWVVAVSTLTLEQLMLLLASLIK